MRPTDVRATRATSSSRVEAAPKPRGALDVVEPGRNCWRVERASRFRCVQDADLYFRLVREALLAAKRSVFVLGWDIYGEVDLAPGGVDDGAPTKLAALLDHVVQHNPSLEVFVLVWDYAALYALERDPASRVRLGWRTHERVRFRFDDLHPLAASHHQKVVVVDDALAFSGGLDLTSHRWDTPEHHAVHPERLGATGEPYTPFHDVQALVEGPAAIALGELARARWRALGETRLPAVEPARESAWPPDLVPDLVDVDVALTRTEPRFRRREAVRECEALFFDQIAAASRTIYIENQYFTNARLAEALARRLRERDGPEVIVVGPRECSGWLEQKTMGALRRVALEKLVHADAHGRLRLLQPVASKAADVTTFVHSKILVVDDEHLRIGSANLSNRSMGFDTECDVVALARGDVEKRACIARVRDRLVGEHLGVDGDAVARTVERTGSLGRAIDGLARGDRTLVPISLESCDTAPPPAAIARIADPAEPMRVTRAVERLWPHIEAEDERSRASALALPLVSIAALGYLVYASSIPTGSSWRDVRELVALAPQTTSYLPGFFAALVLAGLFFVPISLTWLTPVVLFGPLRGGAMALVATAASATLGYGAGRALGPSRLTALLGRPARRVANALIGRGVVSVAIVRLVSLFSATSGHLVCGAAAVRPREYALGTALGLAPAFVASVALGAALRGVVHSPGPWRIALTALGASAFAVFVLRLRRTILMRQHTAADAEQRDRARFG